MDKDWPPDPLLDEIEEARMRILAEHGGDYRKLLEFYMESQKQFGDRLINYDVKERKHTSAASRSS